MVTTALLMPVVLAMIVILFDLCRLYVNGIFAQEVALLAAKLASSADPEGYALPEVKSLVQGAPGETIKDGPREQFWEKFLEPGSVPEHGKNYLTEKEKKVLNLAYGFAHQLSPRIYFPIPVGYESDPSLLGVKPNCSIYFHFVKPLKEAPDPERDPDGYERYLREDRDRIFYVDCVVPLITLSLHGVFTGPPYRRVSRNAYAYRSGNVRPEGSTSG